MTETCCANFTNIENRYDEIEKELEKRGIKKVLLICGGSFDRLKLSGYFSKLNDKREIEFIRFSDFSSNPDIKSALKAKEKYIENGCQAIIAVGGGSAIDTSKCVKLVLSDTMKNENISENNIPLFAIPTTAGSGSEVTRFAVVYSNNEKLSVSNYLCLPDYVFYDSTLLETLPLYQRISTALDAFCHCIESIWSINSTETSMMYAKTALELIIKHMDQYISNSPIGNQKMQEAARYAGMAINISQTTAAHAMSYKLTKMYNIPHGISAGICLEYVWKHNISNKNLCCDKRGVGQLEMAFELICDSFGSNDIRDVLSLYKEKLLSFDLPKIKIKSSSDIDALTMAINKDRLKNNPVPITFSEIKSMYERILL